MTPRAIVSNVVAFGAHPLGRRGSVLRILALIAATCAAAGCAHDVALQNPQTGASELCRESAGGFNPWSQTTACVADHLAQGWTISSEQ